MSHKKFKNQVLARFSIFFDHLFLPSMMLLFSTREIEFVLLFFTIIKDIIFLINYYEKSEQNIVCKGVAGVAHVEYKGLSAVLGVAMIINYLQSQKTMKLINYQLITNNILHFKKVSLKVSLRCRKARHLQNKVSRFNILNFNLL